MSTRLSGVGSSFWFLVVVLYGLLFCAHPLLGVPSNKKGQTSRPGLSIELPAFKVPVFNEKVPIGAVWMRLSLNAYNLKGMGKLEKLAPHLYNEIYTHLYGLSHILWGTGYEPTVRSLKKWTERLCNNALDEHLIKDIVVEEIIIRSLNLSDKPFRY